MSEKSVYLSLAPVDLTIERSDRYDGGGFSISLNDLAPEDVSLVIRAYQAVKGIYDLWLYMREVPNYDLLQQRLKQFGTREFVSFTHSIGSATYAMMNPSSALRRAIHDIRGGGLTSLVGYAALYGRLPEKTKQAYIEQAVFIARDHAKMMRNIVLDIDVVIREADEGMKLHSIEEFVNKWNGFSFETKQKKVQVRADSTYSGFITNRCLETSAVDRILYNYINNAVRFAASDTVRMSILPVGTELTRWIIENDISETQNDWLEQNLSKDFTELFRGGLTRGGHGVGLSSCTDLVAASFGVDIDRSLTEGYLGAKVVDQTYYAWFHWPRYVPESEDEPVCACGEH